MTRIKSDGRFNSLDDDHRPEPGFWHLSEEKHSVDLSGPMTMLCNDLGRPMIFEYHLRQSIQTNTERE